MGIKKFTCVVSLLVLCCLLIVGCGNVQQPQQDAQPQQSQQTEEESDYPNRPINGIIAWGAGGATDVVSRMIGPLAEKELGNPIILSNMTGATGSIGTQFVYDQKAGASMKSMVPQFSFPIPGNTSATVGTSPIISFQLFSSQCTASTFLLSAMC
jgi:tripartite-type tricarboxylate transporter receptor subunit TctC